MTKRRLDYITEKNGITSLQTAKEVPLCTINTELYDKLKIIGRTDVLTKSLKFKG